MTKKVIHCWMLATLLALLAACRLDARTELESVSIVVTNGTVMEVIAAATRQAAYVCGQSDELGTLEEGRLADLIVVAGDPLEDLNALDSVLYVVKDGQVVVSP